MQGEYLNHITPALALPLKKGGDVRSCISSLYPIPQAKQQRVY